MLPPGAIFALDEGCNQLIAVLGVDRRNHALHGLFIGDLFFLLVSFICMTRFQMLLLLLLSKLLQGLYLWLGFGLLFGRVDGGGGFVGWGGGVRGG